MACVPERMGWSHSAGSREPLCWRSPSDGLIPSLSGRRPDLGCPSIRRWKGSARDSRSSDTTRGKTSLSWSKTRKGRSPAWPAGPQELWRPNRCHFHRGTAPTAAAKQATTTIPIVFAFVADPLRSGLIASYASSQNNLTGISNYAGPLSGKRLEIFQEVAPGIKRVLVLVAPQESVAEVSFQSLAEAAPKLGIELLRHDVTSKEEIEQYSRPCPRAPWMRSTMSRQAWWEPISISSLTRPRQDRIPLAVHEHSMVERGALVSYGADLRLLGIQAAKLVAKILNGAKPSEVPVQTPEQLLLTINLTTAKAIGLNIPRSILERTDRFVE